MESPKHARRYLRYLYFRFHLTKLLDIFSVILQLEDALQLSVQDLKYSNSTIQADLDRFQRQKVADMREMAISMARSHRDWCKKVLLLIPSRELHIDTCVLESRSMGRC